VKKNNVKNFCGIGIMALLVVCCVAFVLILGCVNELTTTENDSNEGYLGMSLPADFKTFDGKSPWNSPIGENPEIDPNSDIMIQALIKSLKEELNKKNQLLKAVTKNGPVQSM